VEWAEKIDYKADVSRANGLHRLQSLSARHSAPQPDFVGIRPKIARPGGSETDFVVQSEKKHGVPGLSTRKRRRIFGWPWWTTVLATLALVAAAIVAFRSVRESVLRAAGWALVASQPIAPADVIVLTLDSGGAGALEAADLLHSGVSKRVAVFEDPPSGEDFEFIRRGLSYENLSARQIRQLASLGVTNVERISKIDGTESEGRALPQWCDGQDLRSVLVVAVKDHTRRLQRVLDRDMKGRPIKVTVRAARYSSFDPDRWWETRAGVRIEIFELQKLLLDVVLHPMST
jgi:hypothetical protein